MLAILSSLILLKLVTAQSLRFRGHVTPRIVHHVQRQLWLSKMLQKFRSHALTAAVTISADTVCIEFFAVSLPVLAWSGYPEVAWLMVMFMAMHNYLCLFAKERTRTPYSLREVWHTALAHLQLRHIPWPQDLFCAPRPMQCGARDADMKELQQLVAGANDAAWNAEYGLPSSHTSLTLTYFLTLSGLMYQQNVISGQSAALAALASLVWGAWLGFCRMYSIMHSLADVLAGALLAVLCACSFIAKSSSVLLWLTTAPWLPGVVLAVGSMLVYPKPERHTPSFLDAVAFNGAALGVFLGARYGMHAQAVLDLQSWPHVRVTLAQFLAGLVLCGLTKEAAGMVAKPALQLVLGAAPTALRILWQLPVHDLQSMPATADGGCSPRHLSTGLCIHVRLGGVEGSAEADDAKVAPLQFAHDHDGVPMDVKLFSQLCRYAVLGWSATCVCPIAFEMLGILRR